MIDREDEVRQAYLENRANGMGHNLAALEAGVQPAVISAIINMEPRFAQLVEQALAVRLERVEHVGWQRAMAGVKDFALPILQTQKPDEWMPTKQVDLNVAGPEIDLDALRRQLEARKELTSGDDGDGEGPSAEA